MKDPQRMDEIYTRCPACGLISPAGSLEYVMTAAGGIDWSRPLLIRCELCGRQHTTGRGDLLDRDAVAVCPRRGCKGVTPCPREAARVVCLQCGVHFTAPELDQARRDELRAVDGLHTIELRETYRRARGGQDSPNSPS